MLLRLFFVTLLIFLKAFEALRSVKKLSIRALAIYSRQKACVEELNVVEYQMGKLYPYSDQYVCSGKIYFISTMLLTEVNVYHTKFGRRFPKTERGFQVKDYSIRYV